MALTVKLTDATVQVGGNFQQALGFVKRIDGRTFDGTTKTWSVPVDLKAFRRLCSLPLDIIAGGGVQAGRHITRYGSVYDRNEWEAKQATPAAVEAATASFPSQFAALEQELAGRVAACGFAPHLVPRITSIIASMQLEEMEEVGQVRYSTPERREQTHEINKWYGDEWIKIHEREQDAATMAEEAVFVRYGVIDPQ